MTRHDEVEMLETELAARLGTPLRDLRARRADCPSIDLLRAASGDALPGGTQATIDQHLRHCPLCQALAADLRSDELTAISPAEAQRVAARVRAARQEEAGRARRWLLRPAFGLAIAAVLAWAGWTMIRKPSVQPIAQPQREQRAAAAIPFEMPELKLRASVVLVMRGSGDAQPYLRALGEALKAYRATDYASAAREFSRLQANYPKEIEVFLYGGVSHLYIGDYAAAVAALERARALNEPEFSDEVNWYLGVAYQRAGRIEAARAQLEPLCRAPSDYSLRACASLGQLGGQESSPSH